MMQLLQQVTIPRAVGTEGNNRVIKLQEKMLGESGYTIKSMPFLCKVWDTAYSWIEWENKELEIRVSPYSKGFIGEGVARIANTLEELTELSCENTILFLAGELAKEPLQPKNYPFYFPKEHEIMINLLEEKKPAAIIAVTGKHPMCGLNPYPLFEDGNFQIPSGYVSVSNLKKIKENIIGKNVSVHITSNCIETKSKQIIANKSVKKPTGKIVICGHMDSKNHTQGALDNATGVVALLKTAERLKLKNYDVDIVPFNTEEYYGANGELIYLEEVKNENEKIDLLINIDSVGHIGSKAAVSLYHIPELLKTHITDIIRKRKNMQTGESWYAGDHAAFSFLGVPCLAITSSDIGEGGLDCTHTMEDTLQTVDEKLLVETVSFIEELLNVVDASCL